MAEESPKEAAPKQDAEAAPPASPPANRPPRKPFLRARPLSLGGLLCEVLLTLLAVLGIVLLVGWLVCRPHKPRFYVDSAWIYDLNVTDGLVTSNMRFILLFHNPNQRWTIGYDSLVALVTYRGHVVTMPTPLPNFYQEHGSLFPVYTYVAGNFVPLFSDVARGLVADQAYGFVDLKFEVRGRFRWRTTLWKSTHYHVYVTCDLLMGMEDRVANGQVPLFRGQICDVEV